MDYLRRPKYHYRPAKGWINDPNGLVYYKGYYHLFYQHAPDSETPWPQPMHWGHARTKDFLRWEELPVALYPDREYDSGGCWSGTAVEKDGRLYLFYASVKDDGQGGKIQTVSMAYSDDGISFTKHEGNPVIASYPPEGGPDFRDPALCRAEDGGFYCVMATGNPETRTARLLLYRSGNLLDWKYCGIMSQWPECMFAECPSLVRAGDDFLLTASVCPLEGERRFSVMYGSFENGHFSPRVTGEVDKGPDQYAGQVFRDHLGRNILISWMPGWEYAGFAERDIGCMSVPRELVLENGKIYARPVSEVRHLFVKDDPCVKRTAEGFVIERDGREPVVHRGEVTDLDILRDGYIAEVFVNGGEQVYSVLL